MILTTRRAIQTESVGLARWLAESMSENTIIDPEDPRVGEPIRI